MAARWWAFGVWVAVAAVAVYWGLALFVRTAPVPAHAGVAAVAPPLRGDLSRLLGADPVVPVVVAPQAAPDARFQLVGVVAPQSRRADGEGVALIAVDGKPARAYRIGAVVDGEHVLQSVQPRGAALGPRGGAAVVALQIPPPAAANTGTLPPAAAPGAFVPAPPQSPMPGSAEVAPAGAEPLPHRNANTGALAR